MNGCVAYRPIVLPEIASSRACKIGKTSLLELPVAFIPSSRRTFSNICNFPAICDLIGYIIFHPLLHLSHVNKSFSLHVWYRTPFLLHLSHQCPRSTRFLLLRNAWHRSSSSTDKYACDMNVTEAIFYSPGKRLLNCLGHDQIYTKMAQWRRGKQICWWKIFGWRFLPVCNV